MVIFGHRGAPGFPRRGENTMTSFRKALGAGASALELDVRRCGDSTIMVIHDDTIDRTTTGCGRVSDFSQTQLDAFGIPSLDAVLKEFSSKCLINIEIKETGLAADVRAMSRSRNVIVSSFYWNELSGLAPETPIALLATRSHIDRMGARAFIDEAKGRGATAVHPERTTDIPALLPLAHLAGLRVNVWTVNAKSEMSYFKQLGVDGIFTDFPEEAVR
jgi:glycerophosphoryl diester phosphodiesterase